MLSRVSDGYAEIGIVIQRHLMVWSGLWLVDANMEVPVSSRLDLCRILHPKFREFTF